jgi:Family of unknown function (DUF5335)
MSDGTAKLEASEWQSRLDELTEQHEGAAVTIEVLDQEFGDEEEVEKLPLAYLAFDPKDDVVIVAVGGRDSRFPAVLRHLVEHPREIAVDSFGDGLVAVDIVDGEGGHTIVTIHRPAA